MQKRIFIAINLPEELKDNLLSWQKKRFIPNEVEGLLNWTKPDNMHITLVFIGEIGEQAVDRVLEVVRRVVKNFRPIEIRVDRIHIGPNLNTPRMIWLSGPENKNLSDLARQIGNGLRKEGIELKNSHNFTLHITLARARNNELQEVKIDEKFEYSFLAESIEVMESKLSPGGPKYSVLEKMEFG